MGDRFVLALTRVLVRAGDQAAAERVTARFTDTVGLPFVFEYRGVYYKDDTLIELSAAAPLRGDSFASAVVEALTALGRAVTSLSDVRVDADSHAAGGVFARA